MLAVLDDPAIVHPALECIFTVDEEVGMLGAEALDGSLISGRRMLNLVSEMDGIFTAGCAGGTHQVLTLHCKRNERKGLVLDLKVSGLLGGHSGEMPGRGRANAIIILGRALFNLYQVHPFRLMRVNGLSPSSLFLSSCSRLLQEMSSSGKRATTAQTCNFFIIKKDALPAKCTGTQILASPKHYSFPVNFPAKRTAPVLASVII